MEPLDGEYHSVVEAGQALSALPIVFLERVRRWAAWKLTDNCMASGDDVINDTWLRFTLGDRRWTKGTEFAICFWGAVRSAVNGEWDKHKRLAATRYLPVTAEGEAADPLEKVAGQVPDPMEALAAAPERKRQQDILDHIFSNFAIDAAVIAVLGGIETQMSPQEVQETFGLSETQYDSARRKLRRFLNKHYPNGWRSHG